LLQKHYTTRIFAISIHWRRSGHDFAPVALDGSKFAFQVLGGKTMSCVSLRSSSRFGLGATQIYLRRGGSGSHLDKAFPLLGVALAAATLAACAQTSVTTDKFASSTISRQKPSESRIKTSFVSGRSEAGTANGQFSPAPHEHAKETQTASFGLASSYGEGSQTASGERFNANGLTAAHRTLPFGTRVRVTNHSNGRSVVVTINDRGPFVSGRIIDVTPAAARALGMSGLAPVTIERE
jgi:rare lipoprotein A